MKEGDSKKKEGMPKDSSKESPDEKSQSAMSVTPTKPEGASKAEKTSSPASEAPVDSAKAAQAPADSTEEKKGEEEESSMEDMVAGMASAASGWLSGWMKSLEVAKYKSAEVYDMVKKDLTEFTEAVQTETTSMISETSSMISSTSQTLKESLQSEESTAGQVKKSVSGFLTHVHKVFTPDTAQDDDAEAYVLQDGQPVLLDRLQTELYRLAADPSTYLTEPAESERVRYEVWSADLDLEARQTELSDLLASNRTVLEQYTSLVPAKVSHVLFWHRYLFRVHLAEEKEKQREQLRKRADQMSSPGQAEKQITWEEESAEKKDFSHHVEVTDAQADQLLAEYEAEQRQKPSKAAAPAAAPADSAAAAGAEGSSGSRSPERASSNEDDWVKADIDAETNSSVGNDWEKWD
ncbi:BSD domain-containing protein 1-like isoform X2 [Amphibalanus amphitrite]|uniref:BSD domain-containing protein 1-like isoform X2 n=1 Tax=Amphibalanus amphitrite TaxID=1232801 RepID=UPI001C8FC078|nr:BSD domain-containing protein 1-like isoform X2 [Amphibalanus amphitrite]